MLSIKELVRPYLSLSNLTTFRKTEISMRVFFAILLVVISSAHCLSQDSAKSKVPPTNQAKASLNETNISFKDIDRIEAILKPKESDWFIKYGTILVALVALLGTVVTNIVSNNRSRLNTESQIAANQTNLERQLNDARVNLDTQLRNARENLDAQLRDARENLTTQLRNAGELEAEKQRAENSIKRKNELKELVAQFIKVATSINHTLDQMSNDYDEGRELDAEQKYEDSRTTRSELTNIYYSIKVTLDGSPKQTELESLLDNYIGIFIDSAAVLMKLNHDVYQQPIGAIYHKIKSIVHDNYREPI